MVGQHLFLNIISAISQLEPGKVCGEWERLKI
jgi:hypothetical protein